MGRSSAPTGRAKRIRVRFFCHMGIEMDKRFWEFFSVCRREIRQGLLRRRLAVGFRAGYSMESGPPASMGPVFSVQIEILADDPDLLPFLDEYRSRGPRDGRDRWVSEMVLAGHGILSGNAFLSRESGAEKRQEPHVEKGSEDPKKLLGELFS